MIVKQGTGNIVPDAACTKHIFCFTMLFTCRGAAAEDTALAEIKPVEPEEIRISVGNEQGDKKYHAESWCARILYAVA